MSKRFTDSKKWSDDWWGPLDNDSRIIWLYLIDNCSIAGIWKKDIRGLNFNCNTNITEDELVKLSAGRLVDCGKFFFIPSFIKFQYPNGLGSNKPMILAVKKELSEHNLTDIIKERLGNDYLIIKVMVKEKVMVMEEGKWKEGREKAREKKEKKFDPLDPLPAGWDAVEFKIFWDRWVLERKKNKKPVRDDVLEDRLNELIAAFPNWTDARKRLKDASSEGWLKFVYPEKDGGRFKQQSQPLPEGYGKTLIRDKA